MRVDQSERVTVRFRPNKTAGRTGTSACVVMQPSSQALSPTPPWIRMRVDQHMVLWFRV
jgi:hypothetical protein